MENVDLEKLRRRVLEVARLHPGLDLLILHGSRARLDATEASDWDFAFEGTESIDTWKLASDLADAVSSDTVDLANLRSAGGLLRYRVARDGVPIFDRSGHHFDDFVLASARFWCDAEHVLQRSYDDLLAGASR